MRRIPSWTLLALAALAGCGGDAPAPAPPPSPTVFDDPVKAIERARVVETEAQKAKDRIDEAMDEAR